MLTSSEGKFQRILTKEAETTANRYTGWNKSQFTVVHMENNTIINK